VQRSCHAAIKASYVGSWCQWWGGARGRLDLSSVMLIYWIPSYSSAKYYRTKVEAWNLIPWVPHIVTGTMNTLHFYVLFGMQNCLRSALLKLMMLNLLWGTQGRQPISKHIAMISLTRTMEASFSFSTKHDQLCRLIFTSTA
jgi:hypothetical protein